MMPVTEWFVIHTESGRVVNCITSARKSNVEDMLGVGYHVTAAA